MKVTEKVVEFVAKTTAKDIPETALQHAKASIMDWFFVALAGHQQKNQAIDNLKKSVLRQGYEPQSSIIGEYRKTTASQAAMINGCIGHLLDYDETCPKVRSHLFAAILPAILAASEQAQVSGEEMLTSFIIGHEVAMRIGEAITPTWYRAGWHGTPLFGIFGAVAGCAKLMKLPRDQIRNAVGIAASMASGVAINFGTLTKPMHAGMASERALTATRLAACGFTANPEVLEGPLGFYHAFNWQKPYEEEVVDRLGRPWGLETPGISSIKLYPCCHGLATNIECGIRIHKEYRLKLDDIVSIEIHSQPKSLAAMLSKTYADTGERLRWGYDGPPRKMTPVLPATGPQGKFSKEYSFARALKDGVVQMHHLTDEAVNEPEIRQWMDKIELFHNSELEKHSDLHPEHTAPHAERMILTLKDGRVIQEEEIFIRGMTKRPLGFKDVKAKFYDCGSVAGLSTDTSMDIISRIEVLEKLKNVKALMEHINQCICSTV